MLKLPEEQRKLAIELLSFFTIDGKKANEIATEGELEIFITLVLRNNPRVQILCSTQYGKSLFVALACIIISCVQGEIISVVAPSSEKARIIMRYYIEHLGDSPLFYSKLEKDTKLERLRMEESKERIMLNNRGGIFVLSANSGNSNKGIEAAMGAGSRIVITDESSLIPNEIEATIFRMIAGKGPDAFYCKIGNPFYRNHFLTSWLDPEYYKIFIDYKQGLEEGRYNEAFIEEAKKKPHFDILFGCLFPDEEVADADGYLTLFSSKLIQEAQKRIVTPFGERRLGVDVAEGGGDYNAYVLRTKNYMKALEKFQSLNTMMNVGEIKKLSTEYEIVDRNTFLDTIGVGKGLYDKLLEDKWMITSVKFSESASEPEQFANLRSECYWRMMLWLREGGALDSSNEWSQLLAIKYKVDSRGRLLIMPKDLIRKKLGFSPDIADAAANTFSRKDNIIYTKTTETMRQERDVVKQFDSFKQRQAMRKIFKRT
jgi:hypothetical protein